MKGFALARHIIKEICEEYGISYEVMVSSHRRSKTIVEARHEAIIKVRAETTLSIAEMGDVFGYADHVTVYMTLKKHKEQPLSIVKTSKT